MSTDVMQIRPRTRPASEDELVVTVQHRTIGAGRSILIERAHAEKLHEWLGKWLAEGWPGVPRACGEHHRPDPLHDWKCDQEPGHDTDHEGPAVGWATADHGRPGRKSWPRVSGPTPLPEPACARADLERRHRRHPRPKKEETTHDRANERRTSRSPR